MEDGYPDDHTEALDAAAEEPDSSFGGAGARRAPRQPAEGVRIIGADEAAAAIEAGQVAGRRPDDLPRFGDVPEPPAGPRPALRFPGADPATVSKPSPATGPPPRPPGSRRDLGDEGAAGADAPADAGPPPAGTGGGDRYSQLSAGADGDDVGRAATGEPSEDHSFWDTGPREKVRGRRGADAPPPAQGPASALPHWTEPPSGEIPRILPDAEPPEELDDDLKAWSALSSGPRWRDHPTDWDEADFNAEVLDDAETRVGALRAEEVDDEDSFFDEPAAPEPAPVAAPPRARRPPATPRPRRIPAMPRPGPRGTGAGPTTGGRDLNTSVVTGAVALAVVLVAAWIGPAALVLLVGVALVLAAAELFAALRTQGHHPATLLGVATTASLSWAAYWRGLDGTVLVLALFMVFAFLWYLTGAVRARPTTNIAVTVLGVLYVGFLGSFAALLLTAPRDNGIGLLLGAVIATGAYDAGAFFAGRWAGKTPLAPAVSPGKTVEGAVGANVAAVLVSLVVVGAIGPWTRPKAFVLAVVVSVVAPLGDLCESLLKRDLGIKDMGSMLPGHGGVLDRIDALLFVVPATFYLVRLLNLVG